ncbi:HAMP domain-containing sensor histidine kinase [Aliikangiella coralliicola]|uniref:histidine kinase n=1 Tax=Aliikangiella coralliicola TaxID=2592383 RepID=A0A545UGZ4_9GAMM|nr:HAMP domain-containing sensor histidine kinase [Aliikangiella coralliicola]TQV88729.1 HAMP domain-containing histidine kinase [Aliikangiella coralliicola]
MATIESYQTHSPAPRWRSSLLTNFFISICLALIPVCVVIAIFLQELDQHMKTTRQVVTESSKLTNEFSKLADDLKKLERAIRQNWLLKDVPLGKTIEEKWQQVEFSIIAFANNHDLNHRVNNKSANHVSVWRQLEMQFDKTHEIIFVEQQQETKAFSDLYAQLNLADDSLNQWKSNEMRARESSLTQLQQTFIRYLVAIIPLSLIFAGFFLRLISKQLGRLTKVIDRLGDGQWQSPINVTGSTEIIELGSRLEWMRLQLQRLEQQKDTFLRHVTHELKTPLASIIESSSLLKDDIVGPTNRQQQDLLDLLDQGSQRLCHLIDSLLSYNSFRARRADSRGNNLNLLESKIRQHFEQRLKAKNQQLNWKQVGNLDKIYLDIEQLEIILIQLVSNAIKFSPPDEHISVSVQNQLTELILSVADKGPGIPEAEKSYVFDAFFQGSSGKNNAQQGTGLGLAIVNECVQHISGQIEIRSSVDQGCEITIVIPISAGNKSDNGQ